MTRGTDGILLRRMPAIVTDENAIHEAVAEAWSLIRSGDANTAHALAAAFRHRPQLEPASRRRIALAVFGMLHEARRIDHALAGARAPALHERDAGSDRLRYLAWRVLARELTPAQAAREEPRVDWTRVASVDDAIAREEDPVRRFALAHSLPDFLASRLIADHGDDAARLADSMRQPAPVTLRANALKGSREHLLETLRASGIGAHATRFAEHGVELEQHANVFALPAFHEGVFEVQDEASQLVAELVAPPPRGLVVDACAGAGGKTLAIGALLANRGRVVAIDRSARRLKELKRRAARAGLFNVETATRAAEALRGRADRVLVDAPCSGIGVLRRKPDIRWRITEAELDRLPREQEALAASAMELVAPGGRLVYATCTLFAAENEQVIERLLARGGFEVVKVKEILGAVRASKITDASGTYLRTFPHTCGTDAFFAAVLRRKRT
jgi:16S rRNA (cytosine967-C5)-methyltransferase